MAEVVAAGVEAAGVAGVMPNPMTQSPGRMTEAAVASLPSPAAQSPELALALREPALPAAASALPGLDRAPAWACHRLLQVLKQAPAQGLERPTQHEIPA